MNEINVAFTKIRKQFADGLKQVDEMQVTCVEDMLSRMLALDKLLVRILSLTVRAAEDAEITRALQQKRGPTDDAG